MKLVVATQEHEAGLRALLRREPMPGWVRTAYAWEPDFFAGLAVEGQFTQAIAALAADGRVVGMGTRAVRQVWLHGRPDTIGYLGGLRSLPAARGSLGLARGYRLLRQLHGDGRCRWYLSTITHDNRAAQALLTSHRAGLPHYLDAGRLLCRALAPAALAALRVTRPGVAVTDGAAVGLPAVLALLDRAGRQRTGFSRLTAADLDSPLCRGLAPGDFLVARATDGELVGCLALWDQRAFRQCLVEGYAWPIRLLWPVARAEARWVHKLTLPAAGARLECCYAAFVCVRDDDPDLLRALLAEAGRRLLPRGVDCLVLGAHEGVPWAALPLPGLGYTSRVYLVCWDDALAECRALLASRLALHLEPAIL
jgi:hypothetical protein